MNGRLISFLVFVGMVLIVLLISVYDANAAATGVMLSTITAVAYPKIVQQIHKDFYTAEDVLKNLCEKGLAQVEKQDLDKVQMLQALGFDNTKEVTDAKANSIKALVKINYKKSLEYLFKYQKYGYKFIHDNQVQELCTKYKLVCAEIKHFTGFVPLEKLKLIVDFKSYNSKVPYELRDHSERLILVRKPLTSNNPAAIAKFYEKYPDGLIPSDVYGSYRNTCEDIEISKLNSHNALVFEGNSAREITRRGLFICAPKHDFKDLHKQTALGRMFYKTTVIQDPVVLAPVPGGWLIVAAWGDEASDPIVVNQQNN